MVITVTISGENTVLYVDFNAKYHQLLLNPYDPNRVIPSVTDKPV
jgi:hypothetical protein